MPGAIFRSYRKPPKIKVTSFGKGKLPGTVEQKTRYVRPTVSCCTNACRDAVLVESIAPTTSGSTNCSPVMHAAETGSDHCDQIRDAENKWNAVRTNIQIAYVETSCHSATRLCVACQALENDCISPNPAVILCEDCGPSNFYCQECCCKLHSFIPFHVPKIWTGETYVQVHMPVAVLKRHAHLCGTQYSRCVSVVDCRGRQHEAMIECCLCELPSVTLIRHRLWPSSPLKPNVAFMFDVMELQRILQMEAQVSVLAFCSSLHHLQPLQSYKMVKNVYRALIRDAADEYINFENNVRHLRIVNPSSDDGSVCPACPKGLGKTQIVSVDANFGLVRKRNGGQSSAPAKISTFFVHQDLVDKYVEELQDKGESDKPTKDCNDFKAGNKVRSSVKSAKLDETAVFGAMCRHEYPKAFCNIKKGGEKLGYSMCILEHLKEECGNEMNIIFMYDIACVMKRYLQNRDKLSILSHVTLAVPIFHSYGHRMACQIQYNPRRICNAGLADGECLERLWAYLRKFADMTKSMSAGRRTDVLSSALLHYASKARNAMGKSLVTRSDRAKKLAAEQKIQLGLYLESSPGVNMEDIAKWSQAEYRTSEEKKNSALTEPDEHTWLELHAYKLHSLHLLKSKETPLTPASEKKKMIKQCQRLEKELIRIEKDHNICRPQSLTDSMALSGWADKERISMINKLWKLSMERKFTLALVGKHAEGQSSTNRLIKLTQTVNKNIRCAIASYNCLCDVSLSVSLPNTINFESIAHDDWAPWQSVLCDMSITPTLGQRQAIDAYNLWCRAREEEIMCESDMQSMLEFLKHEHEINSNSIALHRLSNSCLSKGSVHLLIQKVMSLELELALCKSLFSGHCESESTGFNNFLFLMNGHKLLNHVELDLGVLSRDIESDGHELDDEDQSEFSDFENENDNVHVDGYNDSDFSSDEEYDEPISMA